MSRGSTTGEPRVADDLTLPPQETLRLADEMIQNGRPFHAHEVLEAAWKNGDPAERELWQGLAQLAVGLTHAHRGNAKGAVTLLRRGAERVRGYQRDVRGNDLDLINSEVAGTAERLAAGIERDGLAGADLRLRLSRSPE
jgi:uncharacterized protein